MNFLQRIIICALFIQLIPAQEKVDSVMMAKIRDEGMNHSQAMEILWWISDVFGPRLTGSQEHYAAALWAANKFTEMGLKNSHLESWGPFGKNWKLKEYSATMIGRQIQPLISYPKAWSPGLKGEVIGEVIYLDADSLEQLESFKGRLKGKYILFSKKMHIQVLCFDKLPPFRIKSRYPKQRFSSREP